MAQPSTPDRMYVATTTGGINRHMKFIVPAWLRQRLAPGADPATQMEFLRQYEFRVELTEEGILYRPFRNGKPGWGVNVKGGRGWDAHP